MEAYLLPEGTILTSEVDVKRSRFLAHIERVDTAEAARGVIASIRSSMPDARHHCTAFALPGEGAAPLTRSSDDGEPSGTAGRPMLDVLTGVPLTCAVAIVTRYFGGTLLGTGGLVRAYSDAVRECLEGASIVQRHSVDVWAFHQAHADAGRFIAELSNAGYEPEAEYGAASVTIRVPAADATELSDLLARLAGQAVTLHHEGQISHEVACGSISGGKAAPLAQ